MKGKLKLGDTIVVSGCAVEVRDDHQLIIWGGNPYKKGARTRVTSATSGFTKGNLADKQHRRFLENIGDE